MIDRAEVVLHENYGQKEFWKVRAYFLNPNFSNLFLV